MRPSTDRVWTATSLLAVALATAPALLAVTLSIQPPSSPQGPVFRTGTDIVVVEATAVDKAGVVAKGLARGDFQAEIEGHAREVVSAEFIEYSDGRTTPESADSDITTNVEERASRAILIVVDQSTLRFENRGVMEGVRRWVTTLSPSDRLGMVGLPAPGPAVDFTTDHARVVDAFAALKGIGGRPPVPHFIRNVSLWEAFQIIERNDFVRAEVIARECRQGDPLCPGQVLENARAIVVDSQQQVEPVISALRRVLRALRPMPGPKHLVLISSGWPIEDRDATSQLSDLAEDAALSNVTIHVFTVVETQTSASLVQVSPRRAADENMLLSSVETLAGYTGGRSVRPAGNGELAFKALNGGLTGYYRLAVKPAPEDLDGKSKRIGLKVTRPGISLLGYRRLMAGAKPSAAPAATEAGAAVREAMKSAMLEKALALRVTTYVLHGEKEPGAVRVVVVGDVSRGADGPATAVAVLFGEDGKPATGTEHTFQIPAAGPGRVVTMLSAKPGTYVMRLAVADREGRVGSLDRTVDATWHEAGGVTTTGLVLFRSPRAPGGALEPLFDVLSTDDRLIAQVPLSAPLANGRSPVYEVVREGASTPLLRVTGRVGSTSTGALVAEGVVAASELSPGRYTIAASIEPGSTRIFKRTFRVEAASR